MAMIPRFVPRNPLDDEEKRRQQAQTVQEPAGPKQQIATVKKPNAQSVDIRSMASAYEHLRDTAQSRAQEVKSGTYGSAGFVSTDPVTEKKTYDFPGIENIGPKMRDYVAAQISDKDEKSAFVKQADEAIENSQTRKTQMAVLSGSGLMDVNGNDINANSASFSTVVQGIRNIADDTQRKAAADALIDLTKTPGSRFYGQTIDSAYLKTFRNGADLSADNYADWVSDFEAVFYPQAEYRSENIAEYEALKADVEAAGYDLYAQRQIMKALDAAYQSQTNSTYEADAAAYAKAQEQAAAQTTEEAPQAQPEKKGIGESIGDFFDALTQGVPEAETDDAGIREGAWQRPKEGESFEDFAARTGARHVVVASASMSDVGGMKAYFPDEEEAQEEAPETYGPRQSYLQKSMQEGTFDLYMAGRYSEIPEDERAEIDRLMQYDSVRKLFGFVSDARLNMDADSATTSERFVGQASIETLGWQVASTYYEIVYGDYPAELKNEAMGVLAQICAEAEALEREGRLATTDAQGNDLTGMPLTERLLHTDPQAQAKLATIASAKQELLAQQREHEEQLAAGRKAELDAACEAVRIGQASEEQRALVEAEAEKAPVDHFKVMNEPTAVAMRQAYELGDYFMPGGGFEQTGVYIALSAQGVEDKGEYIGLLMNGMNAILEEDTRMAFYLQMDLNEYYQASGGMTTDMLVQRAATRISRQGESITDDDVAAMAQETENDNAGVGMGSALGYGVRHGASALLEDYGDTLFEGMTLLDMEENAAKMRRQYENAAAETAGLSGRELYRADLLAFVTGTEMDETFRTALLDAIATADDIYELGIDPNEGGMLGALQDMGQTAGTLGREEVKKIEAYIAEYATESEARWFNRASGVTQNTISGAVATGVTLATGNAMLGTAIGYGGTHWSQSLENYLDQGFSLSSAKDLASVNTALMVLANSDSVGSLAGNLTGANAAQKSFLRYAVQKNPASVAQVASGAKKVWSAVAAGAAATGKAAAFSVAGEIRDEVVEGAFELGMEEALLPIYRKIDAGEAIQFTDYLEALERLGTADYAGRAAETLAGAGEIAIQSLLMQGAGAIASGFHSANMEIRQNKAVQDVMAYVNGEGGDAQTAYARIAQCIHDPVVAEYMNEQVRAMQEAEATATALQTDPQAVTILKQAAEAQTQADAHQENVAAAQKALGLSAQKATEIQAQIDAGTATDEDVQILVDQLMAGVKARTAIAESESEYEQKVSEARELVKSAMDIARTKGTRSRKAMAAAYRRALEKQAAAREAELNAQIDAQNTRIEELYQNYIDLDRMGAQNDPKTAEAIAAYETRIGEMERQMAQMRGEFEPLTEMYLAMDERVGELETQAQYYNDELYKASMAEQERIAAVGEETYQMIAGELEAAQERFDRMLGETNDTLGGNIATAESTIELARQHALGELEALYQAYADQQAAQQGENDQRTQENQQKLEATAQEGLSALTEATQAGAGAVGAATQEGVETVGEAAKAGETAVKAATGEGQKAIEAATASGEATVDAAAETGAAKIENATKQGEERLESAGAQGEQRLESAAGDGQKAIEAATGEGERALEQATEAGTATLADAARTEAETAQMGVKDVFAWAKEQIEAQAEAARAALYQGLDEIDGAKEAAMGEFAGVVKEAQGEYAQLIAQGKAAIEGEGEATQESVRAQIEAIHKEKADELAAQYEAQSKDAQRQGEETQQRVVEAGEAAQQRAQQAGEAAVSQTTRAGESAQQQIGEAATQAQEGVSRAQQQAIQAIDSGAAQDAQRLSEAELASIRALDEATVSAVKRMSEGEMQALRSVENAGGEAAQTIERAQSGLEDEYGRMLDAMDEHAMDAQEAMDERAQGAQEAVDARRQAATESISEEQANAIAALSDEAVSVIRSLDAAQLDALRTMDETTAQILRDIGTAGGEAARQMDERAGEAGQKIDEAYAKFAGEADAFDAEFDRMVADARGEMQAQREAAQESAQDAQQSIESAKENAAVDITAAQEKAMETIGHAAGELESQYQTAAQELDAQTEKALRLTDDAFLKAQAAGMQAQEGVHASAQSAQQNLQSAAGESEARIAQAARQASEQLAAGAKEQGAYLERIAGQGLQDPVMQELASSVKRMTGLELSVTRLEDGLRGMYDRLNGKILIDDRIGVGEQLRETVTHELIHYIENSAGYEKYADAVLAAAYESDEDLRSDMQKIIEDYASMEKNPQVLSEQDARKEAVAYATERVLAGDPQFIEQMLTDKKQGFLARVLGKIQGFFARYQIKKESGETGLAKYDQLRNVQQLLKDALEQRGRWEASGETGTQAALNRDADGNLFVTIEEDILDGVPEKDWAKTVKNVLRERFPEGVTVGRNQIQITGRSRNEITQSKDAQWLRRNQPDVYADKMRAAGNADEILLASRDYVNEGLNHPRTDRIVDFARGTVTIEVGGRTYDASVVVGTKDNGDMLLYDYIDMKKTGIQKRRSQPISTEVSSTESAASLGRTQRTAGQQSAVHDRRAASFSDTSIAQNPTGVNPQSTQNGQQYALRLNQFGNETAQRVSWIDSKTKAALKGTAHESQSNRAQIETAHTAIDSLGLTAVRDSLMGKDQWTADDVVTAAVAMAQAEYDGDVTTAAMLAMKYNDMSSEAGQKLQAFSVIKRLTADGMLGEAFKNVQKTNLERGLPKSGVPYGDTPFVGDRSSLPADAQRAYARADEAKRMIDATPLMLNVQNPWGLNLSSRQMALIDRYGLRGTKNPGAAYNIATAKQRMLAAILAADPVLDGGAATALVQELELIRTSRYAVATQADLNYIRGQANELAAIEGEGNVPKTYAGKVAMGRAANAVANVQPTDMGTKLSSLQYSNMLGNTVTIGKNIASNVLTIPTEATSKMGAAFADWIMSARTGNRTVAAMKTAQERTASRQASAKAIADTMTDYLVSHTDTSAGRKYDTRGSRSRVFQNEFLETYRKTVEMAMQMGDRPFFESAYATEKAQLERLGTKIRDPKTNALRAMTAEEIHQEATARALEKTFQQDEGVAKWLSSAISSAPPPVKAIMNVIVPFVKTPTNVAKRLMDYSPMGLARGVVEMAMVSAGNTQINQYNAAMHIGRGLTGTGMAIAGAALAAAGYLKFGRGDDEEQKRSALRGTLGEPYSLYISIDGKDHELSFAMPAAAGLIFGANLYKRFVEEDAGLAAALGASSLAMADEMFETSMLSAVNDLFSGYNDVGGIMTNLAATYAGSFVNQTFSPSSLRAIAKAVDPYQRDVTSQNAVWAMMMENVIQNWPGLRQMLPKKIDITGDEMLNSGYFNQPETRNLVLHYLDSFLTPTATIGQKNDEAVLELLDLSYAEGDASFLPGKLLGDSQYSLSVNKTLAKSLRIGGEAVTFELTDEEKYDLNKTYANLLFNGGARGVDGLRDLMESRKWERMSGEEKMDAVRDMAGAAKEAAIADFVEQKKDAGEI